MTGTLFTAICGLAVGAASLGWQIWAHLWDGKARLKMTAMIANRSDNLDAPPQLLLRVVNISKVPVVWNGWGFETDGTPTGSSNVCVARALPKRLLQHEEHGEFMSNVLDLEGALTRVYAWDTTGKNWELGKKQIAYLNKSIEDSRAKREVGSGRYIAPR